MTSHYPDDPTMHPDPSATAADPAMAPLAPTAGQSPQALVNLQETLYQSRQPTRRYLHVTRRDWILNEIQRLAVELHDGDLPTLKGGAKAVPASVSAAARIQPQRPSTALEVGPGSGIYLPTLLKHFDSVMASDVEHSYLNHVRRKYVDEPRLQLHVDDICETQMPQSSFDLILCSEVLEHIPPARTEAALTSIAKLLRPGGFLILSTPQPCSPLELSCKLALKRPLIWLARAIYREPVLPTGHINLLPPARLRRVLEESGLVIQRRHASGLYLPLLAELLPGPGLRLAKRLEKLMVHGPARPLLWTQYYVATRSRSDQ